MLALFWLFFATVSKSTAYKMHQRVIVNFSIYNVEIVFRQNVIATVSIISEIWNFEFALKYFKHKKLVFYIDEIRVVKF